MVATYSHVTGVRNSGTHLWFFGDFMHVLVLQLTQHKIVHRNIALNDAGVKRAGNEFWASLVNMAKPFSFYKDCSAVHMFMQS